MPAHALAVSSAFSLICRNLAHSKWHPIEHRLFSQMSQNWAGGPLRSFETLLNSIRGTTIQAGLTVRARLLEGEYAKGQKVSDEQMQQLNIEHAEVCSQQNYTFDLVSQLLRNIRNQKLFFNKPFACDAVVK